MHVPVLFILCTAELTAVLSVEKMIIYVNARFLTQPVTGVQRYAIECSRKIKKLYPNTLFLTPHNIWNKNVAIELDAIIVGSHTGHVWEQIDLPIYMKKQTATPPLLNPCNTAPLLYPNNFVTLHDLAFFSHPEWNSRLFSIWYNFLIPRLVRKCAHLFTVSNSVRAEIRDTYKLPKSAISVTYNGIAAKMQAENRVGQLPKQKMILAVGSFNLRKNHQSLITAFIHSNIKDTHSLVLVGDENKVFRDTGIDPQSLKDNNIIVHSHLSDEDLISLYCQAEILVSLSVYEGFGIPLLEGLFFGCKLVCSDIPVYRELYSSVATYTNPVSEGAIVNALITSISAATPSAQSVKELCAAYNYQTSASTILQKMLQLTEH